MLKPVFECIKCHRYSLDGKMFRVVSQYVKTAAEERGIIPEHTVCEDCRNIVHKAVIRTSFETSV